MSDIESNVNVGDNRGRVTGIDSRGSNRGGDSRSDVHIDNSTRAAETNDMIRELRIAVFGDSMGWDGVLPRLRQIQKEVEDLRKTITTLQHEVHALKLEMSERTETSHQMRLLLWIVAVGVTALVLIALWPLLTRLL